MEKTFIGVRDVDQKTFLKFKARAVAEKKKLGEILTLLMQKYIEDMQKKAVQTNLEKARKALDIKPIDFGPGSEHLSEQIDDILYGEKE